MGPSDHDPLPPSGALERRSDLWRRQRILHDPRRRLPPRHDSAVLDVTPSTVGVARWPVTAQNVGNARGVVEYPGGRFGPVVRDAGGGQGASSTGARPPCAVVPRGRRQ
jgi:hypothetical protein